ncbi:beta-phosphoglucomutase [Sphingobacterium paludis]|uniref:Beta-phosphoglucomutase n=1 Tax=Sphingobacterium paludis TaxID=1476465 RepID=A0A4R7CWR8_9SPHI|nr:beta-phosphoglucomutase [Sphingobacterium paludis]TDS11142.1 beta-phosphoglucomutase [Sphingobacterium paludis]
MTQETIVLLNRPAYIFDLDGVLVDTAVFHYDAWRRLANELGFDFTSAQNEQLKGVSRVESLIKILNWGGVRKSEVEQLALAEQKNEWYLDMVAKMTPSDLLPGVLEFLEQAHAAGKKIALGSASKNAPLILEKTGISPFFEAIVDGNEVTLSKPDPEVFLCAARKLGCAPEECLVFEDAEAGVAAAIAGKMAVIGVGEQGALPEAHTQVSNLGELVQ